MITLSRRDFLRSSAAGLGTLSLSKEVAGPGEPALDVTEVTIADLQGRMRRGELTSRELCSIYIERIREIDPKLHSVLEVNPDALATAERADRERSRGRARSILHGIPVLIKDNIDTADGMKTTAGSLALIDAPVPERDAYLVARLRHAGAVLLGKTNLSEWANFRSARSRSGWSARGGQTNNPYVLTANPCGSSSGSAVAVSANLAAVAVGTETDGSIICPAVRNGVVGLKPTVGLVSRSGIIPIAHTQDTAGPLTRTVSDAAAVLSVLAGHDRRDPMTATASAHVTDYTRFLNADGLQGARIGVTRQYLGSSGPAGEFVEAQFAVLSEAGATLVDVTFAEEIGKVQKERHTVMLYEFKAGLTKYLAGRRCRYRTLADLIDFNEKNREQEMPHFGQELFEQAKATGPLSDPSYLEALRKVQAATREHGIDAALHTAKLDALVAFATRATWSIAAVAGYPYISVPAGFVNGLPVGLGFFSRAFAEPQLIKFAFAYEQRTRARRSPEFRATYS